MKNNTHSNAISIFIFILYFFVFIAIFVIAVEAIMRMGIIKPTFINHDYKIYLDRDILFRMKPDNSKGINSFGYRGPAFKKKKAGKRIIFLGDSFVMGLDVNEDQTITANLQKMFGNDAEVINMGIIGYGPDQSLIQIENEVIDLDPDVVLLGIYPANDYQDIFRNKLFDLDENGNLTRHKQTLISKMYPRWQAKYLWDYCLYKYKSPSQEKFYDLFETFFNDGFDPTLYLSPDSSESDFKIKTMYAILKETHENLSKHNIPLVVVIFPSVYQIDKRKGFYKLGIPEDTHFFIDDLIVLFCNNLGINHIALYKHFLTNPRTTSRFAIDRTNHYNSQTTEEIATLVHAMILEELNK